MWMRAWSAAVEPCLCTPPCRLTTPGCSACVLLTTMTVELWSQEDTGRTGITWLWQAMLGPKAWPWVWGSGLLFFPGLVFSQFQSACTMSAHLLGGVDSLRMTWLRESNKDFTSHASSLWMGLEPSRSFERSLKEEGDFSWSVLSIWVPATYFSNDSFACLWVEIGNGSSQMQENSQAWSKEHHLVWELGSSPVCATNCCDTLGQSFHLYVPQFPHLLNVVQVKWIPRSLPAWNIVIHVRNRPINIS